MGDQHGDNVINLYDDGNGKKSIASVLVDTTLELYELGLSTNGEAFAIPRNGPRITHLLRGGRSSLRKQLAREYFTRNRKAAPQQALTDALLVIDGFAAEADEEELALRVGRPDGALWLDIGDHTGRSIRITRFGWTIGDVAPVLFKRTELTGALPEPEPGGDLDELWSWLNLEPNDRPLALAWLLAVLYPDMPHPVLGIFGEQGTGKTTVQKILVSLLDPGPVPVRKAPKDAEAWVTAAAGSWVVGLDNLSIIPDWLSDSICRAVTGEGDVRRKLYTDDELAVFAFRRAVVLNGIDVGATRGDLDERMLSTTLHLIPTTARLEEHQLWPAWSKAHPRILGALLDLAVRLMGVLPSVALASKPRMADFARILAGVDELLGSGGLDRYVLKQKAIAAESLTADGFIAGIATLGRTFTGTSAQLLDEVSPGDEKWRRPKGWPANPRAVTQRLRRQAPVMRKDGWIVDEDDGANHDNAVRWTITPPLHVTRERSETFPVGSQTRSKSGENGHERESREPASHDSDLYLVTSTCPDCSWPLDSDDHGRICEGDIA